MVTSGGQQDFVRSVSKTPVILSWVVAGFGVLRVVFGSGSVQDRADQTTLFYFLSAAAILVLDRLREFAFGDYKFTLDEVKSVAKEEAERAIDMATVRPTVTTVPPAEGTASSNLEASEGLERQKTAPTFPEKEAGSVRDDPWKGAFGGKAIVNNRRLSATVAPHPSRKGWFDLTLEVASIDPRGGGLSGAVRFFLHDSFPNYILDVQTNARGVAVLRLTVWGAFTVGALTDGGQTELELDLSELPGAPEEFRMK